MWLKAQIGIILATLIALSIGSPLSDKLDNDDIVEEKLGTANHQSIMPLVDETYRLPNDSIPFGYTVRLHTDIHNGIFDFTGQVQVHLKVVAPTQVITLHYRQINITKVEQRTIGLVYVRDLSFDTVPTHDFLKINLTTVSPVNDEFVLHIYYNGVLREDGMGFYRAYYDVNGTRVWYGTTQFEVTDARHAFPCYDEPGIRAPIQLTIEHDPSYKAISNMLPYQENIVGDYQLTYFDPTPSMQTYLLAFLISPFEYVSNNDTRVEQRIYAKPSSIQNGDGDFAVGVVKDVLEKFEEHLGVPFPLEKMDHAAITQFNFGAMENFGLITYTESGLLLDPNTPSSARESREMAIVRLIAHEYAHQWFGNIVSPKWWTYTWLNEGFATLLQAYIPSLIYPDLNYMNRFITNELPRAFANDVGSSWSMNYYTEIPDELWNKFGAIGYSKSGCVLRMFQEALTPQTFTKGLNYYLRDNYMKAATPHELHVALQRAYDEDFSGNSVDIEMLMGVWEDQAGYPLVSVEVSGNNIVLTQRRYPTSNGEIYAIPLTYSTKSDDQFSVTTPRAWMTTENFTMTAPNPNDWIILNNQQVGYYRVDYSTELWHLIINQLKTDFVAIHPINRAVLQDEIYLAWSDLDRLNITDALEALRYLSLEDEPLVWSKADKFLTEVNIRLYGTHTHRHFRRYVKDITAPHLTRLGFEAVEGERSVQTSLRNSVKKWSCMVYEDDCIDHEYQKWSNFYNTNTSSSFNYCYALTHLDIDTFSEILTGVTTDVNYPSRANYLANLGCNQNSTNLKNLLESTIDFGNVLTTEERLSFMRSVFKAGQKGIQQMFYFIDVHFAAIFSISDEEFTNTVVEMAAYVSSECSIITLALLRNHALEYGFMNRDQGTRVNQAMGVTFAWNAKNFEVVQNWFDFSYVEPVTTSSTTTTTELDSSASTESTPQSEATTPQAASSIVVSLNILMFCVVVSLIKKF